MEAHKNPGTGVLTVVLSVQESAEISAELIERWIDNEMAAAQERIYKTHLAGLDPTGRAAFFEALRGSRPGRP